MNRYELQERLGGGTFGDVVKARSVSTGEVVAVKKLKARFPTWEQCLQQRELKALRVLRHANIVQLKEVVRDQEELFYVFEYMETSLCKLMRDFHASGSSAVASSSSSLSSSSSSAAGGRGDAAAAWFSDAQIQSILFQLLSGLAHMHKHGFFHRDIKPENLLCRAGELKIADLGQAREIRARPPFTDYVATRWYRSPELLLRAAAYNSPADLWACGCLLAELYLRAPLFPGVSEADQLCRIAAVLGPPSKDSWPEGVALATHLSFRFPKSAPVPWTRVLPAACRPAAVQLVHDLLQYDPSRRLTAAQALQHRFFDQQVPRPRLTPRQPGQEEEAETAAVTAEEDPDPDRARRDGEDGASPRRSEPKSDGAARSPSYKTAETWQRESPRAKDWSEAGDWPAARYADDPPDAKADAEADDKADAKRAAAKTAARAKPAGRSAFAGDLASDRVEERANNEDESDSRREEEADPRLSSGSSLQDLLDEFFTS